MANIPAGKWREGCYPALIVGSTQAWRGEQAYSSKGAMRFRS